MSQIQYDVNPTVDQYSGSKSPLRRLIARVVTVASLIVSIAVLKTNDVSLYGENGISLVITYKIFRSYRYMFYIMIVGVVYTLLQIPFAVYYMKTRKHLINHFAFLQFVFYADKIMTLLLATAVGAAFGATMDMKKNGFANNNDKINDKMQDYLSLIYVPAAFLVVGCIGCAISSVHSSLSLIKID